MEVKATAGNKTSLANEDQNLTHFDSGLLISRTFLPRAGSSCTLLFCLCLVYCTQKTHWRVHSLADTIPLFRPFYSFPQNWVKTVVLVCPVFALHEFMVLDNSIRLLISLSVFLSFLPLFTTVESWIVPIICTSLVLPHLHHYVTIPPERWLSFFQALAFSF